jgi:hypothetical protein
VVEMDELDKYYELQEIKKKELEIQNEIIMDENANELAHLTQQLIISKETRLIISDFLKNDHEIPYNKRLKTLIVHLKTIPHHELFVKSLKTLYEPPRKWQWYDPIQDTPPSHLIRAMYIRMKPSYSIIDPFIGKPLPKIFVREISVYTGRLLDKIGNLRTCYFMQEYFGYEFKNILQVDSMIFKLLGLWNIIYHDITDTEYRHGRTQHKSIVIDGILRIPMTREEYMEEYMNYIQEKKFKNLK